MRNHLAEDVLNSQMLHLMELYKASQGAYNGLRLDGTIKLLKQTSIFIKNCRDSRPIVDISDDRLKQNHDSMDWFIEWEKNIKQNKTIKNKEKCLISHQTREDIVSAVLGFEELCLYKLKKSNASIVPNRINSDVVENLFCQQRTLHNGANSNPTYLGYCHSINAVILGQSSVSKKSNTGGVSEQDNNSKKVLYGLVMFLFPDLRCKSERIKKKRNKTHDYSINDFMVKCINSQSCYLHIVFYLNFTFNNNNIILI